MTTLSKVSTPEEQELAAKLTQQEQLENALAQKELELATLVAETVAFNSRYLHVVGRLYAELVAVEKDIAEWQARDQPNRPDIQRAAAEARQRAQDSANAVNDAREEPEAFLPSAEIKQMYRQAAKKYHPDRALNEEERLRRTEIMAKINVAYRRNDLAGLERLLQETVNLPEDIAGNDIGSKLIRAIRRIAQLNLRLTAVDREITAATANDLYKLKMQVEAEEAKGGNPLGDLASQIKDHTASAKGKLAAMSGDSPLVAKPSAPIVKQLPALVTENTTEVIVFLDFETTGLSPDKGCRVIEVGAIKVVDGVEVERFTSLVHPGEIVSEKITEITGISNSMLTNAATADEVMPQLASFISDGIVVAHNARFDHKFLRAEFDRLGIAVPNRFACTLEISRKVVPGLSSYKLGAVANHLGVVLKAGAHRALPDARQAFHVWRALQKQLSKNGKPTTITQFVGTY